jgi:NAD(P)-dependent dehydrogenase (short-subunit alcohol dehydrogenase family)
MTPCAHAESELNAAVKQIGKNVTGVHDDVSNLSDLDKLYATVKQQKGRILTNYSISM